MPRREVVGIAPFDFQIAIWGYDDAGSHSPIDEAWERREIPQQSFRGISLWDHGAAWLANFWINDEQAPSWHALPYVAAMVRGIDSVGRVRHT